MTTASQRMRYYQMDYEEHLRKDLDAVTAKLEESERENDELRALVADMYESFYGIVFDNWSYDSNDFDEFERRMDRLDIGYVGGERG